MSPTTPTTVNHGLSESCGPSLNLLPTGSRPGHKRRAIASLMIATGGASGPSSTEKKRPWSNGVPSGLEESLAELVAAEPQALGDGLQLSPSTVTNCSALPPMKRSPMMPALSTPGSEFESVRARVCKSRSAAAGADGAGVDELIERTRSGLNPGSTLPRTTSSGPRDRRRPAERSRAQIPSLPERGGCNGGRARPTMPCLLPGQRGPEVRRAMVMRGRQSNQNSCKEAKGQGPAKNAGSRLTSFRRARLPGLTARMRRMPARATNNPSSPEMAARVRLSASSCRTIRPRLAPSAARMAISRRGWRCAPARGSRRWWRRSGAQRTRRRRASTTPAAAGPDHAKDSTARR